MRALNYLARREHSRKELARKLVTNSPAPSEEELSSILDKLEQQGYLSDQRMVEYVIKIRRHKFGCQRIVYELKEKGIDDHLIEDALPELKATEFDAAYQVWQKKFSTPPIDMKTRGKQMRFLSSRGFSSDTIHQVLSHTDS